MKKYQVRVWAKNCLNPLAICLIIGIFVSCASPKKLVYFQGQTVGEDTVSIADQFIPTVKKGDVLSIQVSSLNSEATIYFNPSASASSNVTNTGANPLVNTPGYLVSNEGTIKIPLVGQLAVADLNTTEIADLITTKLKPYLKEPTVNVRNLNFRISVLGEVTRPSLFTIPNERITIPEALGLAGDLTIYGRRDNVLVIREEGKKRIFTRIDLTNRDAFRSPYYSLHPNDVIYVEPGKARATSVDRTYQLAPVFIGVLSLIAIIVTRQ
ncbi:polysaccharide biosynthesis/export family protein [Spirosoma utsteinense]|uniref:polysaccharide biosynthesis/export family protein n=1 Tax=Spirosoma utsteinense TaxID=2585773 RepID=UPI001648D512|nr:polysaccharide biosynthesis/export family protein [Spirosoma utsteinense]